MGEWGWPSGVGAQPLEGRAQRGDLMAKVRSYQGSEDEGDVGQTMRRPAL